MISIGDVKLTIDGTTYTIQEVETVTENKIVFIGETAIGNTRKITYKRLTGTDSTDNITKALQRGQIWRETADMREIAVATKENTYRFEST